MKERLIITNLCRLLKLLFHISDIDFFSENLVTYLFIHDDNSIEFNPMIRTIFISWTNILNKKKTFYIGDRGRHLLPFIFFILPARRLAFFN